MKQVLTQDGVDYLWGKIKAKFATITALNNVENKIPTGTLASKNSVDESDLTTGVQAKLNKEAEVKENEAVCSLFYNNYYIAGGILGWYKGRI